MNEDEDKRRQVRTQGKYNPGMDTTHNKNKNCSEAERRTYDMPKQRHDQKEKKSSRKESQTDRNKDRTKKPFQSSLINELGSKNGAGNHFNTTYQNKSCDDGSYSAVDERHSPRAISKSGTFSLGETENGESRIIYKPDFIGTGKGKELFDILSKDTDWLDRKVIIDGQERHQPRLVAWFGPFPYTYSGVMLEPKEIPPVIMEIKKNVENTLRKENIDIELNSVLLNLYRNGKDSVAWHSDDESSMGIRPTIASVSLGEIRRFELRKKTRDMESRPVSEADYVVHLEHGSLIVMDGAMQLDWQHRVPKEYHDRHPRINLTFRTVFAIEKVPRSKLFYHEPNFIPPPHPKIDSAPFEFEQEAFPALGNSSNFIKPPKLQPACTPHDEPMPAHEENTSVALNTDVDVITSMNPSNSNFSVPISHSTGVFSDGYKKMIETPLVSSPTEPKICNVSASPTSIPLDESICTDKRWNDLSKVPVFIPKNCVIINDGKHFDVGENQSTSEKNNIFTQGKPCAQPQSGQPCYANEFGETGHTGHILPDSSMEHNREKSLKHSVGGHKERAKLKELHAFIISNWDTIPFTHYHYEELNVLIPIAKHVESLPIDVICLLYDRMDLLLNRGQNSAYNRSFYNNNTRHNRQKISSDYSFRNRGNPKY